IRPPKGSARADHRQDRSGRKRASIILRTVDLAIARGGIGFADEVALGQRSERKAPPQSAGCVITHCYATVLLHTKGELIGLRCVWPLCRPQTQRFHISSF